LALNLYRKVSTLTFAEKIKAYYTNKKLTKDQAIIELKEGIEITRRVYGKDVPDFQEVWNRYRNKNEAFGYGMYSKIVMLVEEGL